MIASASVCVISLILVLIQLQPGIQICVLVNVKGKVLVHRKRQPGLLINANVFATLHLNQVVQMMRNFLTGIKPVVVVNVSNLKIHALLINQHGTRKLAHVFAKSQQRNALLVNQHGMIQPARVYAHKNQKIVLLRLPHLIPKVVLANVLNQKVAHQIHQHGIPSHVHAHANLPKKNVQLQQKSLYLMKPAVNANALTQQNLAPQIKSGIHSDASANVI